MNLLKETISLIKNTMTEIVFFLQETSKKQKQKIR